MLVILNEILLDNTIHALNSIAFNTLCLDTVCVSFRLMSPSSDKSLRQSMDTVCMSRRDNSQKHQVSDETDVIVISHRDIQQLHTAT